ncbi:MAG: hypothetical protein ACFFER_12935 [Candidatus Thorarchaeota archaeon]
MYPVRRAARMKRNPSMLPLEYFVNEWVDERPRESVPSEREMESPPLDDELTLIDYFEDTLEK